MWQSCNVATAQRGNGATRCCTNATATRRGCAWLSVARDACDTRGAWVWRTTTRRGVVVVALLLRATRAANGAARRYNSRLVVRRTQPMRATPHALLFP